MIGCTAALVLLLDASGSITADDWIRQRDGTAEALSHPAITMLIEQGEGVAVTALAFDDETRTLLPWRILRSHRDAEGAAAALRQAPRGMPGGTDIGGAIEAGLAALAQSPCQADQDIIDLATDGEAPAGAANAARDAAIVQGVQINAIAVGGDNPAEWLRANAITPGGFVMEAAWADFATIMRRKLAREVASR